MSSEGDGDRYEPHPGDPWHPEWSDELAETESSGPSDSDETQEAGKRRRLFGRRRREAESLDAGVAGFADPEADVGDDHWPDVELAETGPVLAIGDDDASTWEGFAPTPVAEPEPPGPIPAVADEPVAIEDEQISLLGADEPVEPIPGRPEVPIESELADSADSDDSAESPVAEAADGLTASSSTPARDVDWVDGVGWVEVDVPATAPAAEARVDQVVEDRAPPATADELAAAATEGLAALDAEEVAVGSETDGLQDSLLVDGEPVDASEPDSWPTLGAGELLAVDADEEDGETASIEMVADISALEDELNASSLIREDLVEPAAGDVGPEIGQVAETELSAPPEPVALEELVDELLAASDSGPGDSLVEVAEESDLGDRSVIAEPAERAIRELTVAADEAPEDLLAAAQELLETADVVEEPDGDTFTMGEDSVVGGAPEPPVPGRRRRPSGRGMTPGQSGIAGQAIESADPGKPVDFEESAAASAEDGPVEVAGAAEDAPLEATVAVSSDDSADLAGPADPDALSLEAAAEILAAVGEPVAEAEVPVADLDAVQLVAAPVADLDAAGAAGVADVVEVAREPSVEAEVPVADLEVAEVADAADLVEVVGEPLAEVDEVAEAAEAVDGAVADLEMTDVAGSVEMIGDVLTPGADDPGISPNAEDEPSKGRQRGWRFWGQSSAVDGVDEVDVTAGLATTPGAGDRLQEAETEEGVAFAAEAMADPLAQPEISDVKEFVGEGVASTEEEVDQGVEVGDVPDWEMPAAAEAYAALGAVEPDPAVDERIAFAEGEGLADDAMSQELVDIGMVEDSLPPPPSFAPPQPSVGTTPVGMTGTVDDVVDHARATLGVEATPAKWWQFGRRRDEREAELADSIEVKVAELDAVVEPAAVEVPDAVDDLVVPGALPQVIEPTAAEVGEWSEPVTEVLAEHVEELGDAQDHDSRWGSLAEPTESPEEQVEAFAHTGQVVEESLDAWSEDVSTGWADPMEASLDDPAPVAELAGEGSHPQQQEDASSSPPDGGPDWAEEQSDLAEAPMPEQAVSTGPLSEVAEVEAPVDPRPRRWFRRGRREPDHLSAMPPPIGFDLAPQQEAAAAALAAALPSSEQGPTVDGVESDGARGSEEQADSIDGLDAITPEQPPAAEAHLPSPPAEHALFLPPLDDDDIPIPGDVPVESAEWLGEAPPAPLGFTEYDEDRVIPPTADLPETDWGPEEPMAGDLAVAGYATEGFEAETSHREPAGVDDPTEVIPHAEFPSGQALTTEGSSWAEEAAVESTGEFVERFHEQLPEEWSAEAPGLEVDHEPDERPTDDEPSSEVWVQPIGVMVPGSTLPTDVSEPEWGQPVGVEGSADPITEEFGIEQIDERYVGAVTMEHRGLADEIAVAELGPTEQQAMMAAMPGLETGVVGFDDVRDLQTADEYVAPDRSDLGIRVLTGLTLLALLLGSLWVGGEALAGFLGIMVLIGLGEFYTTLRQRGFRPVVLVGYIGGVGLLISTWVWGPIAIPGAILATTVLVFFVYGLLPGQRNMLTNGSLTVLGVAWITGTAAFAFPIVDSPSFRVLVFAIAATTVASDVGAFFFGRSWGSSPLAPILSPNKSIEGLASGVVLGIGVAVLIGYYMEPFDARAGAALGLMVAVAAPLGDLAESMIKRALGVKDMGSILPGHGGILDRVDAFLFVLPASWVLFVFAGLLS